MSKLYVITLYENMLALIREMMSLSGQEAIEVPCELVTVILSILHNEVLLGRVLIA